MTKWHAHVAHMAKYMSLVGSPFGGGIRLRKKHAESCRSRLRNSGSMVTSV